MGDLVGRRVLVRDFDQWRVLEVKGGDGEELLTEDDHWYNRVDVLTFEEVQMMFTG